MWEALHLNTLMKDVASSGNYDYDPSNFTFSRKVGKEKLYIESSPISANEKIAEINENFRNFNANTNCGSEILNVNFYFLFLI